MAHTPQQTETESRRSKEDERRQKDVEWREMVRFEDVAWRTTIRNEELAWRQSVRAEDMAWRGTNANNQASEMLRANRRYALLAAAQSLKSGSDIKDVLKLAASYVAWIDSPEKSAPK